MKVLVYGAGVIGSYLTHILCKAGNDVTLLARGEWADNLKKNGLVIRHHLQRKTTTDRPNIITVLDEEIRYDAVFAVMPCHKMRMILEDLAAANTGTVVLVGNNLSAAAMRRQIKEKTRCRKMVLFAFQGTAGNKARDDKGVGYLICERAGTGGMDIGFYDRAASDKLKRYMARFFKGTGYKLTWQDSMKDFLACHVAAVLPLCFITYAALGDFSKTTREQRELALDASLEGYNFLKELGYSIVPKGDEAYFTGGAKRAIMAGLYSLMARTDMGELVAAAHCRHAAEEMEELDNRFEGLRRQLPDHAMPAWDSLRAMMPSWEECRKRSIRARAAGDNDKAVFAAPLDL